jgi:LPS export ABC transporter protein LptC
MMRRWSTLRSCALMAGAAAAMYYAAQSREPAQPARIADVDTTLDYLLQDFSARLLDEQGKVSVRLTAPYLRNDARTGIGTVETPDIRVNEGPDKWHIASESAIISPDREHVTMSGPVRIRRRSPTSGSNLLIDTSDVKIDVTPRTAVSDAPVHLRENGDELEAVGLHLDMIANTYELRSDVRGSYATP